MSDSTYEQAIRDLDNAQRENAEMRAFIAKLPAASVPDDGDAPDAEWTELRAAVEAALRSAIDIGRDESSTLRSRLTSLEHELREAREQRDSYKRMALTLVEAKGAREAMRALRAELETLTADPPDDVTQVMSSAGIVSVVREHRGEVES